MSKSGELRILQYGRSVDAPVNFHHRTGDSEGSGGNMLDLYAQVESAEDVFFDNEDEYARLAFLKGFRGYLKKVFSKHERQFLQRLMTGKEKPHEVGRAMGVDWFKYMQSIQRKAYKNTKPLVKLAELTGWTRAEEFTELVLRRLAILDEGAELADIIPQNRRIEKKRAHSKEYNKIYRVECREKYKESQKKWQKENRERATEIKRRYYHRHREKFKAYRENNREKIREKDRKYRAKKKAEREAAKLAAKLAELATVAEVEESVTEAVSV